MSPLVIDDAARLRPVCGRPGSYMPVKRTSLPLSGDSDAPARCDLMLRGGWVIDGTGAGRLRADVAVTGQRIAAVGALDRTAAAREIDAAGRIVAPGFIDAHTHDDRALVETPDMAAKVSQGVTTVIAGNCGISLAPLRVRGWPPPPMDLLGDQAHYRFDSFGAFVDELTATPPACNAALLIGHITLRHGSMSGGLARPAGDRELAAMERGVDEAMAVGAIGLSTGLDYAEAVGAPTEEIITLARAARRHGGLYASHTRNYFERVEEAVDEALEIAEAADLPLILSHHQVSGQANFGKSVRTLARIQHALSEGRRVGLDAYPYDASSKVLDPARCQSGVRVQITWSEPHPEMTGKDISEVAALWGCSSIEAATRLLPAGAVYFQLSEHDVRRILAFPDTMIGSDGLPYDRHPHPRLWGTFPRVLGHYVREIGLFSLEDAVRRMTGLSAAQFGLTDRGLIRPGGYADLTVFDPETVIDRASFEHPVQPAAGIAHVLVNGEEVWRDGQATGARPGQVLRRG